MIQQQVIHDLLIWIDNHLEEPLSIDIIAARAGYSKWHLQRMFRDITGYTLASYIRSRRLTNAATDLLNENHSVTDLALKYQFDSLPSFIRAFKKYFNQTPTHYRQQRKNEAFRVKPFTISSVNKERAVASSF